MSFWQQLARERELRGITLDEVAECTKIPLYTLEKMESGDSEHLPARVYLIGYLRSYAEVVGLDADDVVLRFEEDILTRKEAPEVQDEEGRMEEASLCPQWLTARVWIAAGGVVLAVMFLMWLLVSS